MRHFLLILLSLMLTTALWAQPASDILTLSSDNTLILNDSFNSSSVGEIMQQAAAMDSKLKSGYPIVLFLYTPGGSIQDGLELFEFLAGLNRPIHTVTLFAASMGFQAVQHLGTRYIVKYGTLMSHKARGGFQGEFGDGMSQMDSRYGLWLRRIREMDLQTVRRTDGKQTLKSYRDAYSNELWLNGWEAVLHGYADKVITLRCGESLKGKTKKESFSFFGFEISVILDACPINQNPIALEIMVATNKGKMSLNTFINNSGKFGKNCRRKNEEKLVGYFGNDSKKITIKSELCASNPDLTIDQLLKEKKKTSKHLTRDLRFHVEHSY